MLYIAKKLGSIKFNLNFYQAVNKSCTEFIFFCSKILHKNYVFLMLKSLLDTELLNIRRLF